MTLSITIIEHTKHARKYGYCRQNLWSNSDGERAVAGLASAPPTRGLDDVQMNVSPRCQLP